MNKQRKICIVTGSRAEYGLLYWLMKEIEDTKDLELQIIATGMHLSPEFGLTYQQIQSDGFTINQKVEILLSSDSCYYTSVDVLDTNISAAVLKQYRDTRALLLY